MVAMHSHTYTSFLSHGQGAAMASLSSGCAYLAIICIACLSSFGTLRTCTAAYYSGSSSSDGSFVQAKGSQFIVNGHPFYVNGFNAYYLAYIAVDSRDQAASILQQAAGVGLTLCRTWAFNDASYHALQVLPGVYDESSFQALDYVLSEAKKNGMRVILSLVDNYPNMGGRAQYVQWARNAGVAVSSDDDFYTNPTIKAYYKNYVKDVITRVNTLTGVAYKDDPTIFAWELMNEPRCQSDPSGDTLHGWIKEMSSYVKSIDGNHLVEAGLEGFYGPWSEDKLHLNPSGIISGTDYIRYSQISSIDFTTVHSYPDIWLSGQSFSEQMGFFEGWVGAHISDGFATKKPLLFAEFGLSQSSQGGPDLEANRVTMFSAIYSAVYSSAVSGGPAAGALVWQLCTPDLVSTMAVDGYAVLLSPGSHVTALIASQSQKLTALNQ